MGFVFLPLISLYKKDGYGVTKPSQFFWLQGHQTSYLTHYLQRECFVGKLQHENTSYTHLILVQLNFLNTWCVKKVIHMNLAILLLNTDWLVSVALAHSTVEKGWSMSLNPPYRVSSVTNFWSNEYLFFGIWHGYNMGYVTLLAWNLKGTLNMLPRIK